MSKTITIHIRTTGLSPGELTGIYAKYLDMRRDIGSERCDWEETIE